MKLYHTGFEEIRKPDVHHGRENADFGQGFYLSPDSAFMRRWARMRKGLDTYINSYELQTDGLRVKSFSRDGEWFNYIFSNRNGRKDALREYDVIIGPIANDTIYDLFGITTSGFLTSEQALEILTTGPLYTQVVIKTEKAAEALTFASSMIISSAEIESYRDAVRKEEAAYQEQFAEILQAIVGE
ncbi:MAG: DUF3990 domain-containing protein [Eubacterium sp.]|nr:DUF3990 domain-containing protein [Eubacterium sp.]